MASHNSSQQTFDEFLQLCKEFDDLHRAFLQTLMQRRYIEEQAIGEIFLAISTRDCEQAIRNKLKVLSPLSAEQNRQVIDKLHSVLNAKLFQMGLYIAQLADEFSRSVTYWILASDLQFSTGLLQASSLQKEEVAMFHHWLKLMFLEHKNEDDYDSAVEEVFADQSLEKTGGELSVTKAMLYAKRKGWTLQRAQKLLEKLWKQQNWIRIIRGGGEGASRFERSPCKKKPRKMSLESDEQSMIRLHPCAVAELEQLLNELHVPSCVLCKHAIVVSRLSFSCDGCGSCYHANCMLKELEFPANCLGQSCNAVLEEEVMEDFAFDPDRQHILPRRSGTTFKESTFKSVKTRKIAQPFAALRMGD